MSPSVRWSNTPQAWIERLSVTVLAAAAGLLLWYAAYMENGLLALLWILWAVGAAIVFRQGWLTLFGPILFYDLVRLARRSRYFMLRTFYLAVLFFFIFTVYQQIDVRSNGTIRASQLSELANSLFVTFMAIQMATIALLTPPYTAGAIAEEKEQKTLEFLLATDLRNREIVLGKLASRFVNLVFLMLGGLPILSLLELLGGIEPTLVIAGFAATGMTIFSLAGLSILNSVNLKKPRDAIASTYLVGLVYLMLSSASWLLLAWPKIAGFDFSFGLAWFTATDLVTWFNVGNIFYVITSLETAIGQSARLEAVVPALLRSYCLFHGIIGLVTAGRAISRLRYVALREGTTKRAVARSILLPRERPPVGKWPMVWKEIHAGRGLRLGWLGRIAGVLLFLGCFVPADFIIAGYYSEFLAGTGTVLVIIVTAVYLVARNARLHRKAKIITILLFLAVSVPLLLVLAFVFWETEQVRGLQGYSLKDLSMAMAIWCRITGTVMGCLILLYVGVHASGTMTGERDRQTLETLLTTPLENRDILLGKWLGSLLSVRWILGWLAVIWLLGVITGGLHVVAVPLLVAAMVVYSAFMTTVGLWFSTNCRTTLRATTYTLLTALTISAGQWLPWVCCLSCAMVMRGRVTEQVFLLFAKLQAGLTPPAALAVLAFQGEEFDFLGTRGSNDYLEIIFCCLLGLVVYGVVTMILWQATYRRFTKAIGRGPFPRPMMPPPASKIG